MNIDDLFGDEPLNEAPIGQWEISPDFNDNENVMLGKFRGYSQERRHWMDKDRRVINDPKHVEIARNAFKNAPVTFNIYFWQGTEPDYDPYLQQGLVDYDWLVTRVGQADADRIQAMTSPDAVTIVMTNNLSDEYPISLKSPWMLAHRISHAIEGNRDAVTYYFERFIKKVTEIGYGIEWPDAEEMGWHYADAIGRDYMEIYGKLLGHILGTMNSARKGILVQYAEWAHESFAQFIINGKVTFKPLPERFDIFDLTDDPAKRARVLRLHAAFPRFISEYFRVMLMQRRGQIFVV